MDQRAQTLKPRLDSLMSVGMPEARRLEFNYKNEVIVTNQTPVDFVFIGDSITHFWELDAYFARGLIVNRGIGGDTSGGVLSRFKADALQLKPKHVVLMIGINDTAALDGDPLIAKAPLSQEFIYKQAITNITQIVALAAENDQPLILSSITPINRPQNFNHQKRNELIAKINQRLHEIANEKGLIYVDYHGPLTGPDGITLKDGLADDGLHLHVLGYNVMADVLRAALNAHSIAI